MPSPGGTEKFRPSRTGPVGKLRRESAKFQELFFAWPECDNLAANKRAGSTRFKGRTPGPNRHCMDAVGDAFVAAARRRQVNLSNWCRYDGRRLARVQSASRLSVLGDPPLQRLDRALIRFRRYRTAIADLGLG